VSSTADEIAGVLARAKARVAERRANGSYPPGLEEQLDRHYRQITEGFGGDSSYTRELRAALDRVNVALQFSRSRIDTSGGGRLGTIVHKIIGRLTIRQTLGIMAQTREFADAARDALFQVLLVLEGRSDHAHPDADRRLATALDRISQLEQRVAELEGRAPTDEQLRGNSDRPA
jgi:hypothetical protein